MPDAQMNTDAFVQVDRRRFPRLQIFGDLQGQLVPLNVPVAVVDISAGGFAVESPVAFALNAEYLFRFSSARRGHPMVRAMAKHCMHVTRSPTESGYYAGFRFVGDESKSVVESILQEVQEQRAAVPSEH